jgi:hypothetical protein
MALFAGLTSTQKLAGIFGLSSYLLLQSKIKAKIDEAGGVNNGTKVFMGHGDADQMVRYEWGKLTAEKLKELGIDVDFRTYQGLPHSASPEEMDDLEGYLRTVLPPLDDKGSNEASKWLDGGNGSAQRYISFVGILMAALLVILMMARKIRSAERRKLE